MANETDQVDYKCQDYRNNEDRWKVCRDVVSGEDEIKEEGERYLPKLSSQSSSSYDAYKNRAQFLEATSRTVDGLTGLIFRKAPTLKIPASKEESFKEISVYGEDIESFANGVTREVFAVGRVGILLDMDLDGSEPYLAKYKTETIINWKFKEIGRGKREPVLITLSENGYEDEGEYGQKFVERARVLYLDESGIYNQKLFVAEKDQKGKKEWLLEDEITPQIMGVRLDYIPFVFINVSSLGPMVEKPPILGIANVNLSHYRSSADLEHGRHLTALPTPWAAGFDIKGDLILGSEKAWVTDNENAHCGFLEYTGQGLAALETALEQKEKQMAVLGARLLEPQKVAAEAADTLRIRRMGENSITVSVANMVSAGLTKILRWWGEWQKIKEPISIELNTDLEEFKLDPSLMTVLMSALQVGNISFDTWFYNLQQGELIPDGVTSQIELEKIKAGTILPGKIDLAEEEAELPQ